MKIFMICVLTLLLAISIYAVRFTALYSALYGSGGGLDGVLEETPPRLMDALGAESGDADECRPNKGFWNAVERAHPWLWAALDFDAQIPPEDRARYDGFWSALRDQDDAFWEALDRDDNRRWAQHEREHAVKFPVPSIAGGGLRERGNQ